MRCVVVGYPSRGACMMMFYESFMDVWTDEIVIRFVSVCT